MLLAVTESQTISSPYITSDPKLNRSNFKIQQTDYPPPTSHIFYKHLDPFGDT